MATDIITGFKVTRNLAPDDWHVLNKLAAAGKIASDISVGYPYRYRILDAQCLDVIPASDHIYWIKEDLEAVRTTSADERRTKVVDDDGA